jgi:heat shock protein HslJ
MSAMDKRLIGMIFGMMWLVFTACASPPGSIPNTGGGQTPLADKNLANTKWQLVSFGQSGQEAPVIAGSTITLVFNSEGLAGGSGSCNAYSVQYEVKGGSLSFGDIIRTLTACKQEGIGQQEQRYFLAIQQSNKFELAGDRLTIWYDDGQGVLNFVNTE